MDTLLLDRATWDLTLTTAGNIAVASNPYSLSQDAASAIKTFSDGGQNGVGEVYWDTTLGIPYFTVIFRGPPPSISAIKQLFVNAALSVPDVASAQCFFTQASNRMLTGQIQVTAVTGQVSATTFVVQNPQGGNIVPTPPTPPPPSGQPGQLDFTRPGNPLIPGIAGF